MTKRVKPILLVATAAAIFVSLCFMGCSGDGNQGSTTQSAASSSSSGSHASSSSTASSNASKSVSSSASQSAASSSAASESAPAAKSEAPDFRAQLREIDADRVSDPRFGGTTLEMNEAGLDFVSRYESLMNDILDYLRSTARADAASLEASQAEWEARLTQEVESTAEQYGRGTGRGPAVHGVRMDALHQRIEELLEMIPL